MTSTMPFSQMDHPTRILRDLTGEEWDAMIQRAGRWTGGDNWTRSNYTQEQSRADPLISCARAIIDGRLDPDDG